MTNSQNSTLGFTIQMNNSTTRMPNIDTMKTVKHKLHMQMRQQEIRLDIMKNDKLIRFFLEEDELDMVSKVIEQKIAYFRNCCSELIEDCNLEKSTNKHQQIADRKEVYDNH